MFNPFINSPNNLQSCFFPLSSPVFWELILFFVKGLIFNENRLIWQHFHASGFLLTLGSQNSQSVSLCLFFSLCFSLFFIIQGNILERWDTILIYWVSMTFLTGNTRLLIGIFVDTYFAGTFSTADYSFEAEKRSLRKHFWSISNKYF